MGVPTDADGEDGFNPFTDDDAHAEKTDKSSVSWSYSQYLNGLDKEEVLNQVDERTFSSLSDKASKLRQTNRN